MLKLPYDELVTFLGCNSDFSECLEDAGMIYHLIQSAKSEGRDLHIPFLDLANGFGSLILSSGQPSVSSISYIPLQTW